MHMTFSEFLEKKNEAINMRKAIIAGTSGALVALGCSGPGCAEKNSLKQQVNQVEEVPSQTSKKHVIQKSKQQEKQEAERQERIKKQQEKERKKEKQRSQKPGWQRPKNILGT